jgi:RsiW-degrading membrane proteinase PrsW (M82 family)
MNLLPFTQINSTVSVADGNEATSVFILIAVLLVCGWFAYKPIHSRENYSWRWVLVIFILALLNSGSIAYFSCAIVGILAHFSYDVLYRGKRL